MIIRNLTPIQRNNLIVSAVNDKTRKLMVSGTAVEVESYFQSDIKIKTILRIRGWGVVPFVTIQDCFRGVIINASIVYSDYFNKINFNNVHHIISIQKIQYNTENVMINGKAEWISL